MTDDKNICLACDNEMAEDNICPNCTNCQDDLQCCGCWKCDGCDDWFYPEDLNDEDECYNCQ